MPVCQDCGNRGHEKDTTKFQQHGMQYAWDKPPRYSCKICDTHNLKWTFRENLPAYCEITFVAVIVFAVLIFILLTFISFILQSVETAKGII